MACPICSSDNIKQIYKRHQLFLFRCYDCRMIFLDKINYDLMDIHESYWKMLINSGTKDYSLDSALNQHLLLNDFSKYRKKGNLFEVGCGTGKFLKLAQERGWQVRGTEVCLKAATIARQEYGLNVLTGSLQEVCQGLERASFDVIVMWGVIEHLQNPVETLRIAKSLLRKGGVLVIYTPNANSIFHKLARAIYFSTSGLIKFPIECLIIPMHLMYFTPDTLEKAITKCDFLIRKIKMSDINLNFIFKAHSNFWWSNKIFLICAKFMQRVSHFNSMHSHMIVFAESI